jgi:ATP-dependent DNA helicase RecG
MARFRGAEKFDDFIDSKNLYGNTFKLLFEGHAFIDKHLLRGSYLQEDQFEGVEVPTLPFLAVREALANALCHRDYRDPNDEISLGIYDDRLGIWSTGVLPDALKVEDLKKKHIPLRRNKAICNVFYNRGTIETWGSGTTQMIQRCKDREYRSQNLTKNLAGYL